MLGRRIAHLSDVHILDRRGARSVHERVATRVLSYARSLDSAGRIRKLRCALESAKRSGADDFVFSGDLTEVGSQVQFEIFAEVLADARIAPERVILVPGNHDLYTSADAWKKALDGPLRVYAASAAQTPGKLVDHSDVVFMPLDVTRHQSLVRSGGELTSRALAAVERRLHDVATRGSVVVLVQHHPPFGHAYRPWQWIDGLAGHTGLLELLGRWPELRLLHGHMHAALDGSVNTDVDRVFGASAVVDDEEGTPRVRIYELTGGGLSSLPSCATLGGLEHEAEPAPVGRVR